MTIASAIARLRNSLFDAGGVASYSELTANKFTEAALEEYKREGMELAVRARWFALAVFAVVTPLINPRVEVLYYEGLFAALALIGWQQRRVARVERSRAEVLLIFADILLVTVAIVAPNPLASADWPAAMEYRAEGFKYFYLFLAFATLAYSWRTVRGVGSIVVIIWSVALGFVWILSSEDAALTAATETAFGAGSDTAWLLNPNNFLFPVRIQEVIVFVIVAWVLSITVQRYARLLVGHAALARERENLGRYFSPNVVDELSQNDEPLKSIRTQNVAVLFVDIVGFTTFAAERSPEDVIVALREFHKRMETEIFRFDGTLDKYLGDGLMATFGTPIAHDEDALNALRCARAMIGSVTEWNKERAAGGEAPIQANFGLHYGPVVLGDIGVNRLEFAVIGNTVNVASRVEALTRNLNVRLAATSDLVDRARVEGGEIDALESGFVLHENQEIRGLDRKVAIWGLS